ncbi:MAG: glycosyltransferase family 2 protein [Candidatus Obscuribacterales bacterium]|nr:glycosyltransferase family 2 protein [Candidatus Obscuribacterales bacterium]
MIELSVIIPAYNEEGRLPKTLDSVYQFLSKRGRSFEVLVVDDGSHDATADLVINYSKEHPEVRILSYQPNRGKGFAVRSGMMAARGEAMLIDDADGSSPIEEVEKLEDALRSGFDIAIGSRAKPDESRKVDALLHRKFIGNTFNAIVQSLLLPGFYDTQCGFKLFKRHAARDIFSVNRIDGFGFDVEVLYIARMRAYKTTEIAINWANMEGSKVNVLVDSPKMLLEVLKVTLSAWCGFYKVRNLKSRSEGLIGVGDRERDDAS